jgi:hypothetical protein
MSIIYEALKKVENKLELTGKKNIVADVKRIAQKKPYYFYLVAIVVGLTLASITYNVISKRYLAKVVKISASDQGPAKLGNEITLNGIVFTGDSNYALLNNQIVREGDAVRGIMVKRITSEVVELDKNGVLYRLSNRK